MPTSWPYTSWKMVSFLVRGTLAVVVVCTKKLWVAAYEDAYGS
jgi:hypothetical protein